MPCSIHRVSGIDGDLTMTIAKKLTGLVLLAVLAMVLSGGLGMSQLLRLDRSARQLGEDVLPAVTTLSEVARNFEQTQSAAYRYILNTRPEDNAALLQAVNTPRKALDTAIASYSKQLDDAQDRALYEADQNALKAYLAKLDLAVKYNTDSLNADARDTMSDAVPLADAVNQALSAHTTNSMREADDARQNAASAFRSAATVSGLAYALFSLALGLAGWHLGRSIVGALSGMRGMLVGIESNLDLTRRYPVSGGDEIAQAGRAFNKLLDTLQESIRGTREGASHLATLAAELAGSTRELSQASEQQGDAVQAMAAGMEEMSVSIHHVCARAVDANRTSSRSGELARSGGEVIGSTVEEIHAIAETARVAEDRLKELEAQTREIEGVVQVIREVADQTNLLALNAAIEAARAGEQGRGFAVVADEVRKLAERTTRSTTDIAATIGKMRDSAEQAVLGMQKTIERVDSGVHRAGEASEVIRGISSHASDVVGMVSEISDALEAQGETAQDLASKVELISRMADENRGSAASTRQITDSLATLAADLRVSVERYRV